MEESPQSKAHGTRPISPAPDRPSHQGRPSTKVGPKHIAIAVGALALTIAGLVFALEGSQPDFVCRAKGECREYGRCASLRFACTVEKTADCRASNVCRKDGLCSAGGGACVAAADEDCASSETCKKDGRCAQLEGRCTGEGQQAAMRAMAAQQAATSAVADYLRLVSQDYKQFEASAPHLEAAEWGTATFNGRTLPAAIVRTSITITDRLAGEKRAVCTITTAINDSEYKMWRAKQGFMCRSPKLAEELAGWRADATFQAKGTWAESPTLALSNPDVELTDAELSAPMTNATFIASCGAPDSMKVTIKGVVQNGRAIDVGVQTDPPSPSTSACVEKRVRELKWRASSRRASFTTTY